MSKTVYGHCGSFDEKDDNVADMSVEHAKRMLNSLWGCDEKSEDPVNHPNHYTNGSIECIDAMVESQGLEAVESFCLCNAFKYIWRHKLKNGVEDIRKAKWYLDKFLELFDNAEQNGDKTI